MEILKDCPVCGMTVSACCECPVCKANVLDVPCSERKGEKYKLCKLFWRYFFKKCWFFLACFALVILKIILFGITVRIDTFKTAVCVFLTFFLLILSFCHSLFPEWLKSLSQWKYNENYIDMVSGTAAKYIFGAFALFFTIAW